jgi:hypothetical protein
MLSFIASGTPKSCMACFEAFGSASSARARARAFSALIDMNERRARSSALIRSIAAAHVSPHVVSSDRVMRASSAAVFSKTIARHLSCRVTRERI